LIDTGRLRATSKHLVTARAKDRFNVKKSIISALTVVAVFCAGTLLQSCSDTGSQTTYTTSSDPGYGYAPTETTTTTTTTNNQPDSVVGATGNAVGTIVEAPFEIVGDALGVIF
jgi:hypothetical protein